jgi:hypothetical protein
MSDVGWYESTEVGLSPLSAVAGSLLAALRAVLVTGFNVKSVASITVADGVATVVCATHGFQGKFGQLVAISGAALPAINGSKNVSVTGLNGFTFPAPGVPDGAVAGTLVAKRPSLGWSETFSEGNVSVFRANDVQGVRAFLRVEDTGAGGDSTTARVQMYESMSSASVGLAPAPATDLFWLKAYTIASYSWVLCGDSRAFYLGTAPGSASYVFSFFGDYTRLAPGASYKSLLTGGITNSINSSEAFAGNIGYSNPNAVGGAYIQRTYTSIGGGVSAALIGTGCVGSAASSSAFNGSGSAGYGKGVYPNAANNALMVGQLGIYQSNTWHGYLPGLYHVTQDMTQSGLTARTILVATNDLAGRNLLLHSFGTPNGGSASANLHGFIALDLTGPWVYQV